MSTVTVKVDKELKKKMRLTRINWSEYVREAIKRKIELEERKTATEKLLENLKTGKHTAPKGFINEVLRDMREAR